MKKLLFVFPIVALLAAGCSSSSTSQPTSDQTQATTVSIAISNLAFSPAAITIKKGAKVTWTNQDNVAHTITGDNGGPASGTLANGNSYSFTFSQTGTFPYHCSIHPMMKGAIVVEN